MSTVDTQTMNANAHQTAPLGGHGHDHHDLKRKRSPSHDTLHPAQAPLPKTAKTHNHLQINYLARQCDADLPLLTNDDTLPNIISLLEKYQGVLDRHESMACNLGARPLGPILIKRFERIFEGPPRVLKSHGKEGTSVTWLDVVEFARNKPEQFQLGQQSEGVRVCQFYTKQCRVQISEEDFVLISSGIPQKMIPPQPIVEDEEKELGTIEILEKNLGQIISLADQVAARTRQLNHKLKGRKQAILDRRATASPAPPMRPASPSNVALMNGAAQVASSTLASLTQSTQSSPGGFVAVNARPHHDQNGSGASQHTRHDLMSKFHTLAERRASSQPTNGTGDARRPSISQHPPSHPATPIPGVSKPPPNPADQGHPNPNRLPPPPYSDAELQHLMNSPVPIPNTPSNLLPAASQRGAQPQEKDDGGPYKAEMVHRMEALAKGERIMPPCDRCRRLHMDCLKNLTACMGCTKKHAKCSWREVRESEIRGTFTYPVDVRASSSLHRDSEGEDADSQALSRDRASSTGSPVATNPAMLSPRMSAPIGNMTPNAYQQLGRMSPGEVERERDRDRQRHREQEQNKERERDRERDRGVEKQLQEAAKSGLAHANAANARLSVGAPGEQQKEVGSYQAMVA